MPISRSLPESTPKSTPKSTPNSTPNSTPGSIRVDPRFCGPPGSGNGGYVAGRLAAALPGPAVVRLHRPPPLDRDLAVVPVDDTVELRDGDTRVATARATSLDAVPPPAPSAEDASAGRRAFRGFEVHPFPGCFVCGPDRGERDGLRIFPGPMPGSDHVACPWTPDETLAGSGDADASDHVAPEFLWSALDCPGAFAFPQVEGASVLGELTVEIRGPVRIGQPMTLVGWLVGSEGRKRRTGTALYDRMGTCVALGAATWIELAAPS